MMRNTQVGRERGDKCGAWPREGSGYSMQINPPIIEENQNPNIRTCKPKPTPKTAKKNKKVPAKNWLSIDLLFGGAFTSASFFRQPKDLLSWKHLG